MSRDFNKFTDSELSEELASLEQELADHPEADRLKNLLETLHVHQIELEMQNRELLDTQQALQAARDRFADLYDFAPNGYLTLDAKGIVQAINLTGARMLGKPRAELLERPFASYLEPGQGQAFFGHLRRTLEGDARTNVELSLRPAANSDSRYVSLESVRALYEGETVCRTAMIDVTGRRQADQSRQESEARLALIADHVPVLISYVDADRRYAFNNAAYERWFGHSPEQLQGRHMREVLGEAGYDYVKAYVDKALAGEEVHFETDIAYQAAGDRYVSASYIPHRERDGSVTGFFVLVNDLSARRRAERALSEEQEFVSAVLDTAGALVAVFDRQGRIVRFNRECERVTGYAATEVEGERFDIFLLPEERESVEALFRRLSSGDFPNSHENYWATKDGERRLIAWSNTALTDAEGRVSHVVATGVDITDQRRMEEDLRHREQQLRLVTDAMPVLIAYVDRDMRYQFANAAYRYWFGLDPDSMIGQRVGEVMETKTFDVLQPYAERALQGEEVFYENVVHHRFRGTRDVIATLVPDRGDDGSVNGYFSVVSDITERRRSEDSDKRRLLEAAHADRLSTMGEMTTEIAHELNQPLTAIATTADVCIGEARSLAGDKGALLTEALEEISAQAHRAAKIIKQVRSFARRRVPEFCPTALKHVIDQALSLVRVEARSSGVAVDAPLPESPVVEADAVLVEQLFVNLARNAIEAMTSAGTEAPRLTITAVEADGAVEVRVADNGPGLSVEAREHLFEPFYTTKMNGMGLGLAICRSIVDAHGGRMWADSAPDGGAEFGFTLNTATREVRAGDRSDD